jgi:hypothetical protein
VLSSTRTQASLRVRKREGNVCNRSIENVTGSKKALEENQGCEEGVMKLSIDLLTQDGVRRAFEPIPGETVDQLAHRLLITDTEEKFSEPLYTARIEIQLVQEKLEGLEGR